MTRTKKAAQLKAERRRLERQLLSQITTQTTMDNTPLSATSVAGGCAAGGGIDADGDGDGRNNTNLPSHFRKRGGDRPTSLGNEVVGTAKTTMTQTLANERRDTTRSDGFNNKGTTFSSAETKKSRIPVFVWDVSTMQWRTMSTTTVRKRRSQAGQASSPLPKRSRVEEEQCGRANKATEEEEYNNDGDRDDFNVSHDYDDDKENEVSARNKSSRKTYREPLREVQNLLQRKKNPHQLNDGGDAKDAGETRANASNDASKPDATKSPLYHQLGGKKMAKTGQKAGEAKKTSGTGTASTTTTLTPLPPSSSSSDGPSVGAASGAIATAAQLPRLPSVDEPLKSSQKKLLGSSVACRSSPKMKRKDADASVTRLGVIASEKSTMNKSLPQPSLGEAATDDKSSSFPHSNTVSITSFDDGPSPSNVEKRSRPRHQDKVCAENSDSDAEAPTSPPTRIESPRKTYEDLLKEIQDLRQDNEHLRQHDEILRRRVQHLEADNKNLHRVQDRLHCRVRELEAETKDLRKDNEKTHRVQDCLRQRVREAENVCIPNLRKDNDNLRQRIRELEAENSGIPDLSQQNENLLELARKLETENRGLPGLSQENENLLELARKLETENKSIPDLRKENDNVRHRIQELETKRIPDLRKCNETLLRDRNNLHWRVQELENRCIPNLRQQNDTLHQRVRYLEAQNRGLSGLRQQNERLRHQNATLRHQNATLHQRNENLDQSHQTFEAENRIWRPLGR